MTGNEVLSLCKRKIKNNSTAVDWETYFQLVVDDIFGRKVWKFSQRQLMYIHPQNIFEKTFDADSVELSLTKINSIRCTRSFAGNPPVPVTGTSNPLDYIPLQRFMKLYPEQTEYFDQLCWTELHEGDGSTGKQIGIYGLSADDFAVWIDGDFIPTININDGEIPILPRQFHRLIYFGVVMHAADDNGQDKLSLRAERWYERGIDQLIDWDRRNPAFWPVKRAYDQDLPARNGPYFPSNFPMGVGRP